MSEYCCRIERMVNGYEVEMKDPKIIAANRKPNKDGVGSYRDPYVSYVFKSVDEVLAFLKKNLDKALPDDEYETSFDAAMAEDEEEA
jgi:hypothetical protein